MHVLAEIAAEHDAEENAENATEYDRRCHLEEADAFDIQDIEGGQEKERPGEAVGTGAGDRLDMHGFGKGILAAEDDRHAHRQNGNRGESINGLADFQAEIADGEGKHSGIKNDVAVDFHVVFVGVHYGLDGQYFL